MDNIIFSTKNLDEFAENIANEVVRRINLQRVNTLETKENDEKLLTIDEAAILLHLSKATLYSKVSKKEIPGVCKQGKRLYFSKENLSEWIKSGKIKSNAELEQDAENYLKQRGGSNE